MSSRRRGLVTLTIALCAQLLLGLVQHGLPALSLAGSIHPEVVLRVTYALQLLGRLGLLGALVSLARGGDSLAKIAKVGASMSAALLVVVTVQWALHAQLPSWATDLCLLVGCATPVACWLVLVTESHARGRSVPRVVTFVFGFAMVVRLVGSIAFAALMSRSILLAGVAGTAGAFGNVLASAAQLALAFPLLVD